MSNTQPTTVIKLQDTERYKNFLAQHLFQSQGNVVVHLLEYGYFSEDGELHNMKQPARNQYRYVIDMNERGEFSAHVDHILTDKTVWEVTDIDEAQQLIDGGFLSHLEDTSGGIENYLICQGIIPDRSDVIDENDEPELVSQNKMDHAMMRLRDIASQLRNK